jgi:hypothetical protein
VPSTAELDTYIDADFLLPSVCCGIVVFEPYVCLPVGRRPSSSEGAPAISGRVKGGEAITKRREYRSAARNGAPLTPERPVLDVEQAVDRESCGSR